MKETRNEREARRHRTIGGTIGGAIDRAVGSAEWAGRTLLGTALRLPGVRRPDARTHRPQPGAPPGIEYAENVDAPPPAGAVSVRCIDYSPDRVRDGRIEDAELDAFLAEPRPQWAAVRWINVDGLHANVINRFREVHGFHTLAAEDVLNVPQRPKAEAYEGHLFLAARMMTLDERELSSEQITMFLSPRLLITFQERPGDVFGPIRDRIHDADSRLRGGGADFLLYALLDAMVDHCFPILERYGDLLEELEEPAISDPTPELLGRIYAVKRELALLRRVTWPTREMVSQIQRDETGRFSPTTRTYLRDVYDHAVQVIDIIETYREVAGGLTDLYMSAVSNRMNEVMKVLTIISTLFIPITFLAGIYGMNFKYMPELGQRWAYPAFWAITVVIVSVLLAYFYRKGWLGKL